MSDEEVLGAVIRSSSSQEIVQAQRVAWLSEISTLRKALQDTEGWVVLEFNIPRLGSRIDAVVLSGPAIIPIEFKVGEKAYTRADFNQAWDYALELKNFHSASHDSPIFPILVASDAPLSDAQWGPPYADGVYEPRRVNSGALSSAVREAIQGATGPAIDGSAWSRARYSPTPTIIEAARALYAGHSVHEIARSEAKENLHGTSAVIDSVITTAAKERFKAIIFVTGVPGSGKTLVGLNVATRRHSRDDPTHAVFLSGNEPLVRVLREALTRDAVKGKARSPKAKPMIAQRVKAFIQNVHHFRDEGVRTLSSLEPADDRVVVFDEAQRAWNLSKTADFMKRRKDHPGFDRSEPQFLIEYMNRHQDWAVIVCLVGGGQEIHTGEAGIGTWLDALTEHFPNWHVYISPLLSDSEYAAGHALERLSGVATVQKEPALHLAVSIRSFRAEKVSAFVKALLDVDTDVARMLLGEIKERYPVALTRDLERAKRWTRDHARGSQRFGLVASSRAQRLKPYAVDVRVEVDPVKWFLNDADDTRSSYYLEDAATEYQIQGLELDWTCVTWDADLRLDGTKWRHRTFKGKKWESIHSIERQQYLVNAYRVLLTRARQGMIIFVPPGDRSDPTRLPEFYESTYLYLRGIGIPSLE
jgi:hypothetical protein